MRRTAAAVGFLALYFLAPVRSAVAKDRLVFALDLIRHGDRSPLIDLPAVRHRWPQGLGELTPRGIRQEYELGSRMRALYVEKEALLPPRYDARTLYVRSTDLDRTLMSAESFLAGLYPQGTGPRLGGSGAPSLPGAAQPIPVHTVPHDQDSLLIPDVPRRHFKDLFQRLVAPSAAWRARSSALQPRFAAWSRATGVEIGSLIKLINVRDALFVDRVHGIPAPPGLGREDLDSIESAWRWANVERFAPPEIWREGGAELIRTVAGYLDQASRGETALKYVLFSAHDITLLVATNALGAPLKAMPRYASRLNFSLFRPEKGSYSVRVSLNDRPLALPGCGATACTLAQFDALLSRLSPKN